MSLSSLQLEAFQVVAQKLHFSQAAKVLGLTQSAVSQRLSALEEELGTTLILRDSSQSRLTDTGQKLLRYCQIKGQLENEFLESLQSKTPGDIRGVVRLGGFSSITRSVIVPALAPILRKQTGLSVSIYSHELIELMPLLKSSQLDFVVSTRDPERSEMAVEFLGFEENVLVEARKFPGMETYLDHDERDITTNAYFKIAKKNSSKIKKRYLDDVYGLIDGVRLGYGKAVLPLHLIEGDKDFHILQPQTRLRVPMYLVHYAQPFYGKAFLEVKKEILKYFKSQFSQKA